MDKWLINGVDRETISVNDRGLSYGDGLFETIAIRQGKPRFFAQHFARLKHGCERLAIQPPNYAEITKDIAILIQGFDHAAIKVIVTRGAGKRGYSAASATSPQCMVGIEATIPSPSIFYTEGINARICDSIISSNPALAGLKSLNRLEQVLARSEWSKPAIKEGLMVNSEGHLICGTMSNLFVVLDDVLLTPDLSACGIHGLMRQRLIDSCISVGIPVSQTIITRDMLNQASEVLLTNSLFGLWPVRKLGELKFRPREFSKKLMRLLAINGVSECEAGAGARSDGVCVVAHLALALSSSVDAQACESDAGLDAEVAALGEVACAEGVPVDPVFL